jgi:hypothetical protein
MTSKAVNYAVNFLSLLAFIVAASAAVYQVWHTGLHRTTLAEHLDLPPLNASYHSDAPLGTYVVTFSDRSPDCRAELGFYRELAAAARRGRRPVRVVMLYPTTDGSAPAFLREHDIGLTEVVAVAKVNQIPALYLIDSFGAVRGYWKGILRDYDKARVLQAF